MNRIDWTLILRTVILIQFSAKKLLAFIRPVGNSMYGIYDPFEVKLINKHNFSDYMNPLCSCTLETENTEHFFLSCQNNLSASTILMNELNNISNAINSLNSTDLIKSNSLWR